MNADEFVCNKECAAHRVAIAKDMETMIELSESKQNLEIERMINTRFDVFETKIAELLKPVIDNQSLMYRVGVCVLVGAIVFLAGLILGQGADFSVFF